MNTLYSLHYHSIHLLINFTDKWLYSHLFIYIHLNKQINISALSNKKKHCCLYSLISFAFLCICFTFILFSIFFRFDFFFLFFLAFFFFHFVFGFWNANFLLVSFYIARVTFIHCKYCNSHKIKIDKIINSIRVIFS